MATSASTPDLQQILATLAQYATPSQTVPSATTETDFSKPLVNQSSSPDPRFRPMSAESTTSSPKPIDPATITTWPDGLRCVTKIAAQNASFAASVKKMMADQKRSEMRWYSERQALKHTQATRASSSAKAHLILSSLNGGASSESTTTEDSIASNEAELAAFDRKVYAAQLQMEESMTAELKALGVPFFGTNRSLVVPGGQDATSAPVSEGKPRWSPVVTDKHLMDLRRRMVGHLEDLYKD